jgi:hypothetical protein
MSESIRAVQYGVGAMGRWIVEMMLDKGIEVVGGIDRPGSPLVGQDLGEVCGLEPLGVAVSDRPEETLRVTKPDVVTLCTTTYLADLWPQVELCARLGLNVVSTSEELYYPWRTAPELAHQLDAICKETGCTVLGCGYQDWFWTNQVLRMAGTCHSISSISGIGQFDIDDFGPEVANDHMVGLTVDEFAEKRAKLGERPSYMQMVGDSILAGLGLTYASMNETVYQTTASRDIECKALGKTLPKGIGTGNAFKTHFETVEGVHMDLELISKVYEPGEAHRNEWMISGRPDVWVQNNALPSDVPTCTSIVSRIPDVIAANPGLSTPDRMPPLKYRRYMSK